MAMSAISTRHAVFRALGTLALAACVVTLLQGGVQGEEPKFKPDDKSLEQHEAAPEWLCDAKLGIYFHWGVYSVPAYSNEWYPRNMFLPGSNVFEHHLKTYGHPTEFGYHDFVPMFKAEKFDPDQWAELFAASGARFAGPVAEHHDGFSMWDSDCTPWNAADRGPQRDILGELFTSIRKHNMKTIATFHHSRNLQRYEPAEAPEKVNGGYNSKSHYPNFIGYPTSSDDADLPLLYGNIPEDKWLEEVWFGKLQEVIDNYQPDIIWFDSWLGDIPDAYRKKFCAYYLNRADEWGKQVAIVRKQDDLPLSYTVFDHEKSRESGASEHLWMTDDTISTGSWCYTENLKIKPFSKVLHALVDTVSKNGVVLLNLSPKADGTIPDDQQKVLHELGAWLKLNGEAIYGTRPWIAYGEGPTQEPSGGFSDHGKFLALEYTDKDIRYTASKDGKTVYAILLGTPAANSTATLTSFAGLPASGAGSVTSASLVVGGKSVECELGDAGLKVTFPEKIEASPATAVKIVLQ